MLKYSYFHISFKGLINFVPWGQCMTSRTMHSKHQQQWHSFLPLPHRGLRLQQHSDLAPRLCNGCGKLPHSQGHCIDDISKNKIVHMYLLRNGNPK